MLQMLIFYITYVILLMLHMLFLNVAKKITCCMQHHTLLRQEFFLLTKHPMPRARIGRPGASISVSKIEGQCLSGFGAQGWKLDM